MDTHASAPKAAAAGSKHPHGAAPRAPDMASSEAVRLEFDPAPWRLDATIQAPLRAMWSKMDGEADTILDEFYRFMNGFPENAPHIGDKGKVDCLKLLQKEHWKVFFDGAFNEDYVRRVHAIGAAHARVSLPSRTVFAGYSFLMERMVRSTLQRHRRQPAEAAAQVSALIRAMLMEIYYATEVYSQTSHNTGMLTSMQELAESFEHELDQAVEFVRRSAGGMEQAADAVLEATGRVAGDAEQATSASNQANGNAQTIAAAAEELSSSIAEISRQVEHSTTAAEEAATQSQGAKSYAENLASVSSRIGNIVKLIERISKETRLLALNANIEAARAGDAGRGFAVVANEVKTLADQTNRATGDIRAEIEAMQAVIANTVAAIGDVATKVEIATGNISGIAGAVTEQEAVTREIAQSAARTADSIQVVHGRITSVATAAESSNRETGKLRQDTQGMVDQVIGIKRRVIATLRNTRFADRRKESREAIDLEVTCVVQGRTWKGRTDNLSMAGVQVRAPDLAATIPAEQRVPGDFDIAGIGSLKGFIVCAEQGALHVHLPEIGHEAERKLGEIVDRSRRDSAEIVALAKDTAIHVSRLFEQAIDRKDITWEQMWDVNYRMIPGSEPAQYATKFLELCDRLLPPIQEPLLKDNKSFAFIAAVDRNGYLPTHNLVYSQPQRPGDKAWNTANCRNRRIFDDRTGLSAARNRQPVLVQTYRRDMGNGQLVTMKDISAPIMIHGQHWGGLRIGCRI